MDGFVCNFDPTLWYSFVDGSPGCKMFTDDDADFGDEEIGHTRYVGSCVLSVLSENRLDSVFLGLVCFIFFASLKQFVQ